MVLWILEQYLTTHDFSQVVDTVEALPHQCGISQSTTWELHSKGITVNCEIAFSKLEDLQTAIDRRFPTVSKVG